MTAHSKKFDVVVAGGAHTDLLIRGPRLPQAGEVVHGYGFHHGPGGKGANQALAVARLGARVAFVGRIGDDEGGELLLSELRSAGVNVQCVIRDSSEPTGTALIMVDRQGEKQVIVAPGANQWFSPSDVLAAESVITDAKAVLVNFEIPQESAVAVAKLAAGSGAFTILEPSPVPASPLPDFLFQLIDLMRVNSGEASALTGILSRDRQSARLVAEKLLWAGAPAVIVQGGNDGNLLIWDEGVDQELWLPRLPVKTVDGTGAGEAFLAAIAVAITEGRTLSEAAAFGNGAAALATTVVGAQKGMPTRKAVFSLLSSQGRPYAA